MTLYQLTLHFPDHYGSLDHRELTLTNTEYFDNDLVAIARARTIAKSFVTPQPDYWYLKDSTGMVIFTETPDLVKEAIHYHIRNEKPTIIKTN